MRDLRKSKSVTTWANKPALSTLTPYTDKVMISDVGVGGSEWYSDGVDYVRVNPPAIKNTIAILGTSIENLIIGSSSPIHNDGSFIVGNPYKIVSVGNTDFVAAGAVSNTQGIVFTAKNAGTSGGTGTASLQLSVDARSAFFVANSILNGYFSKVDNFGVSSDTVNATAPSNPGFLSRVPAIVAGGYGYCWVGFPINDVNNLTNAGVLASTIPTLLSIYKTIIKAGITLVVNLGVPSSTMSGSGTTAILQRLNYCAVQKAITDFVKANPSVIAVNCASVMTNPDTGVPMTSPAVTLDGLHDNYEGAVRKGRLIADALRSSIGSCNTTNNNPISTNNYVTNTFGRGSNATGVNGALLGTGITGVMPSTWSMVRRLTGAAVCSRASRTDDLMQQPQDVLRAAITCTSAWDGVQIKIGGDDANGLGRYDKTWAASEVLPLGNLRNPTVANGYIYRVITAGTTSGTQPTWGTSIGSYTNDGTVVYECIKKPTTDDLFYAEAEVLVSGLPVGAGALVNLRAYIMNTTPVESGGAYYGYYDSGSGLPPQNVPTAITLRTPVFACETAIPRYLIAMIGAYGTAGATFNLDVLKCSIIRVN